MVDVIYIFFKSSISVDIEHPKTLDMSKDLIFFAFLQFTANRTRFETHSYHNPHRNKKEFHQQLTKNDSIRPEAFRLSRHMVMSDTVINFRKNCCIGFISGTDGPYFLNTNENKTIHHCFSSSMVSSPFQNGKAWQNYSVTLDNQLLTDQ